MKCFFPFKDKKQQPEKKKKKSSKQRVENDRRSSSRSTINSPRSIPELYAEKAHFLRVFTYSELRKATNGFNKLLKIGEGGFGSVYKAAISPPDGEGDRVIVAVKKLKKDGLQGHKQWVAEVQFLGVVEHPNLVKLVGYCAVDSERGIQRLLVYEFIPNKSLEEHLFNRALPSLPWNTRLQILLGAAQGLVYLHEDVEVPVIYRDFKSSNVLLDNNFKPKLSDFGLAREGPTGEHTHVSTDVVGTHGYAAPDYIETGHLTTKSDVFSFGVVLYEVLTGRRPFETNVPNTEQKLLDWVKQFPSESKRFSTIMDPRLQNQYSLIAARRVAKLAESCVSWNRDERPNMREVVECIKLAIQDSDLASPAKQTSKSVGIYPVNSIKGNDTESEKSLRTKFARLRGNSKPVG